MRINEGISPIVYHFTEHVNAFNIIKSEQFQLSPAFRNDVEEEYAKNLYFLSTTRSRQGSYHRGNSSGVMFTIDGRKVNARYKGGPVDYWQRSNSFDEMEDRVHHNKPTMPIKGIVTGIDVLINIDDSSNTHLDVLQRVTYLLYLYTKKNGLAFNAYRDVSSFLSGNPKGRYSHEEVLKMKEGSLPDWSYSNRRDMQHAMTPERHDLYNFIEIYYRPYDKLNKRAKELYARIVQYTDTFDSLRADISNSSRRTNYGRKMVDAIGKIMDKEGITSFKQLYDKVKERITKDSMERQKAERRNILMSRYEKEKDLYDHVRHVLETGEEFNRDLFPENEDTMRMKLDQIATTLHDMDMISDATKERWFAYGGLSDSAWEFLFGVKVDY